MRTKLIFLISLGLLFISLVSCQSNLKVKLYMVKDNIYFTYKLNYIELTKEQDSVITMEDLKLLYEQSHGEVLNEFIVK